MPLQFHKMHGAGNDFVVIDGRGRQFSLTPDQAARLADRHRGVGCDQILVIHEAANPRHRARYEIRNADGSSAGQCGNGARCIAFFLDRQDGRQDEPFSLEFPGGEVRIRRCAEGEYEVVMGVPCFEPAALPARLDPPGTDGRYRLDSPWGTLVFGIASMGNPHAVLDGSKIADADIPAIGEYLGNHEAFPEGCNVSFARRVSPSEIQLRVIERGTGETLACGSGACAAVAVLRRQDEVDEEVAVFLPGGRLVIKWPGENEPLTMKGPASYVFRGILDD